MTKDVAVNFKMTREDKEEFDKISFDLKTPKSKLIRAGLDMLLGSYRRKGYLPYTSEYIQVKVRREDLASLVKSEV